MDKTRSDSDPEPRSILVVLPTWVGDFVMATPTLRAIRGRFPGAHIVFLQEPNLGDLIRGGDWMNECVEWPLRSQRSPAHRTYRDFVWDLRRRRFDWAVLLSNSFRSALFAWFIRARRRFGFDRDGRGVLLTDRIATPNRVRGWWRDSERAADAIWGPRSAWNAPPVGVGANLPRRPSPYAPIPLVEYYAHLAQALGCDHPGDRFELFTTHEDDASISSRLCQVGKAEARPMVVLSPGATFGASKCWMPERFAAVADRLTAEKDATVVVTCGPGEEAIARAIASNMDQPGLSFEAPLLSLGELKSLVRRADLWIGNDAGPRHIAKAFGVPAITIFGPTHPDWTATKHHNERIVRIDVDCGPCQQRVCPPGHHRCMSGVTVESVHAAARELLDHRIRSRDAAVATW